jgi:Domain of unknown function (DUF5666)
MPPRLLSGVLFLAATASLCQQPDTPQIAGLITRVASPTDFDIKGMHVLLAATTQIGLERVRQTHETQTYSIQQLQDLHPYLGEPIEVYGNIDRKKHTIAATRILFHLRESREVSGLGILDAVLPTPANATSPSDRLVRADGYPILISANTKTNFEKPLASASDIQVNVWIAFHGKQRADGIVVADKVNFSKNTITHGEDKLREKTEYDPATVDPDSRQGAASKLVRGIDPEQIPPYKDAVMQARVSAIGAKLVPRYQFNFPETEETRIDFRFQLVDSPQWPLIWTLPSGIILVPRQSVERMENDSQLAAILADSVACALEKQQFGPDAKLTEGIPIAAAAVLAGLGGGLIAWGVSDAVSSSQERIREAQSGRVSLSLMRDAGYNVDQAPYAWRLVLAKNPQKLAGAPIPGRAQYLYQFLGETWPPGSLTQPDSAASAQQ